MRPASAYIDRKRVPNEITHDEMKVEKDRPKTATPMGRRREIRRKEAEETERRSKPSFGGVEDLIIYGSFGKSGLRFNVSGTLFNFCM